MPAQISGWICILLLAFCSGKVFGIEPDPCIPPDTVFAMKIKPRQILASALVKDLGWDDLLKAALAANGSVKEFIDTAGLRIDRDLESILWCQSCSPFLAHFYRTTCGENLDTGEKFFFHSITGHPLALGEKDALVTGLILLEGRFKPKSIIKAIEKHGKEAGAHVRKSTFHGEVLLQLETLKGPLFVAFQGNSKIIVSNQKPFVGNCLAGGFDKPISPKIADCLSRVSETDSLWAFHLPESSFMQHLPLSAVLDDNEVSLLNSVKDDLLAGLISVHISDGIQAKMGLSTKAKQAKTVLENLAKDYVERISKCIDQSFLMEKPFRKADTTSWSVIAEKMRISLIFLTGKQSRIFMDDGYVGITSRAGRKKLDPLLAFISPEEE